MCARRAFTTRASAAEALRLASAPIRSTRALAAHYTTAPSAAMTSTSGGAPFIAVRLCLPPDLCTLLDISACPCGYRATNVTLWQLIVRYIGTK